MGELILEAATVLLSIGVAYGTVKAKLHNKIGFDKHLEICENATNPIYEKIDKNHTKVIDILMEIKGDIGEVRGELRRK